MELPAERVLQTCLSNWTTTPINFSQQTHYQELGFIDFAAKKMLAHLWVGRAGWWLLLKQPIDETPILPRLEPLFTGLISSGCGRLDAERWLISKLQASGDWDLVTLCRPSPLELGSSLSTYGDLSLREVVENPNLWLRESSRLTCTVGWWGVPDIEAPGSALSPLGS
ncbi:MAG: hypothetical protein SNJ84_01580, partial [Verrucomicrobiia bacterium]